jgi:hypothetical protein
MKTKQEQVDEWMATKPVIRDMINGKLVETTGEDRRSRFESAFDELEISRSIPLPVPESVLSHQLFTALSRRAIPESTIAAIIAAMPDGQGKIEADLAFRRAPQIRRDHPIVSGIAHALSLSTETVDDIFREAALI